MKYLTLLLAIMSGYAAASGWNDFSFNIDSRYLVIRSNAEDIRIMQGEGEPLNLELEKSWARKLVGLAIDEQFICARYESASRNGSEENYGIIDLPTGKMSGPFNLQEFEKKAAELGVPTPVQWQTVREAFRQALREGRADPTQVDNALMGQLLFLWLSIALLMVPILFFMTVTFFVARLAGVRRLKQTSRLFGWFAGSFLGMATALSLFFIARWGYMRFL